MPSIIPWSFGFPGHMAFVQGAPAKSGLFFDTGKDYTCDEAFNLLFLPDRSTINFSLRNDSLWGNFFNL